MAVRACLVTPKRLEYTERFRKDKLYASEAGTTNSRTPREDQVCRILHWWPWQRNNNDDNGDSGGNGDSSARGGRK